MKHLKLLLCVGASTLGLGLAGTALADDQASGSAPAGAAPAAAPAAPAPTPMPYPSMTAPLAANPNPPTIDAGPLGKVTVDGVLSGMVMDQTNPQTNFFGNVEHGSYWDVSNAQVIINKSDGLIQFYVQAGTYSVAVLGQPYYEGSRFDRDTFGFLPQGFVKIVPNSMFSVEIGALPTLIGDEYTFSFQNMNIERGLLWNQEPAVSKGVQFNLSKGPWSASVALTDGYYSGDYTSVSGLLTYTFKNSDTLTFAGEGNAGTYRPPNVISTFVTAPEQANGQIYNIIYSHSMGPLTISPYVQYTSSPYIPGVSSTGETWGGALLAKYNFTPQISLAGRFEYVASDGPGNLLGYGVNSNAWSITLTPTYQKGIFYVRGEASYVGVTSGTPGLMFGSFGAADNQTRFMAETGVIF